MSFTVLIPARLASTRLPDKPLADIAGVPMVVRVAQRAVQSGAARVVVAADSRRIVEACAAFGVTAVLTRPDHPSGSDRLAEACDLLGLADGECVVNVQGDEPLIDPALIDAVAHLREPWPERLQRGVRAGGRGIDLVLHTGALPAFDGFRSTRRLADHALRADGSRVALKALASQPLLALAGIAKPEAFFAMLRARGLVLAETRALPDHYTFDSYPRPQDKGYTVICTEKDAVKLFSRQADVLAVPLEFSPEAAFFTALDVLLAPLLSPLPSSHGHQTA